MQSSTVRAVAEAGEAAGRAYGLAEAKSRELTRLLKRLAKEKFGVTELPGRGLLNSLAQAFAADKLLDLGERLLTATSPAEWLAGISVPPPAAELPGYAKDLDIDLEPSGPSIDTHAHVTLHGGAKAIVHLRMQKWYQPDLDSYLFKESRKLERKYGKKVMVGVFLMWPPAEGPGMTGRHIERDARGKVIQEFTYTIRRAWEFEPEEVMHSPGTMLLAPLTKGSRQRMPEIVQMVKKGLDASKPDAKTREMVWAAFYWGMGLVCDLEEAHRALGDMWPVIQASGNYLSAKGHAFMDSYSEAQNEGAVLAARELILRLGTRRFGAWPEAANRLAALQSPDVLDAMVRRVLTARDWQDLFPKSP
jgi:hypothetical protein